MACKLRLAYPVMGMPHIYNISRSVGTSTSEANSPTDVRLVKLLTKLVLSLPMYGSSAAAGCKILPTVNEQMDQCTGFWIYFNQVEGGFKADGAVSPAPNTASKEFYIVRINAMLFRDGRQLWDNLPSNAECGPMLARELA